MKLKTIIIILLIAAAAYVGYKWYTSKKEDKEYEGLKCPEEPSNKEELPKEYLEAKESIEKIIAGAAKDNYILNMYPGSPGEFCFEYWENYIGYNDEPVKDFIIVCKNKDAYNKLQEEYNLYA